MNNRNVAKTNMIKQQLRTWGVLNEQVLTLVNDIERAQFVPSKYRNLAYADIQIPLEHDQIMLEPKSEAQIVQALDIKPTDIVLEIGTGSGYLTALLAKSAKQVRSVDIFADFTTSAAKKLEKLGIHNVELSTEDATDLSTPALQKKYNVIVVTSAFASATLYLHNCLAPEGRLFSIVGAAPAMAATLTVKDADGAVKDNILFETVVTFLINMPQNKSFKF